MKLFETAPAIAMLSLALACGPQSASKPGTLFPETNEASGWSKTGETRTFEAGNLWQYIDGDAEKYIQAGIERTLTADYRYQNQIEAVADIHLMREPEGARKVFESESSMGSRALELGDAGRLYGASLTFRKGPYFVRLVAYQDTPQAGSALVELGRAIERKLGPQPARKVL